MTIGLGQILILVLILILLFGNFPTILKEIALGIKNAKQIISQDNNPKIENKESEKK